MKTLLSLGARQGWLLVIAAIVLGLCWSSPCLAEEEGVAAGDGGPSLAGEEHSPCMEAEEDQRYEVVSLEWKEVQVPVGVCIWILIASLAKLGFHFTRLPEFLPESCLLIIIGFVIGGIIKLSGETIPESLSSGLDTDLFFLFLLPPIMLEAGYFMPARSFFDNIGTILLYAVVGTLFNTFTVGFSLYGISELGWYGADANGTAVHISLLECLTFSSLISAVDPVAVLAVFEEVHVNEVLYILVFGESLLNDAVTVVLYRMFESFNAIGTENLLAVDIVGGFFSFFVVSVGGVLIGVIFGFLTALLTRLTHKTRVIEPIFVFAMAYMAYLVAEMFRLSSILAIVFCAIFMKPYVEENISQKSHTTIKYFLKMLSSISETIIFIFLGVDTLVNLDQHQWNTVFVVFTLVFCLLYRSVGVILQTGLANTFRLARICKTEQFIMAYGGLRGAIAFSLVALLCRETVDSKAILFTTCIVVIMFTVFIQGTTIKPLVDKLKVRKATKHKPSMNEAIFDLLDDHLMVGIEEILGQYGHHHWREKWETFSKNLVEPLLLKEQKKVGDPKILAVFGKLNQKDAMDYIKQHGSFALPHDQSLSNMLRNQSSDTLCIPGRPSYSGLPLSDSAPCLDMQQMGTAVPSKHVQETSSHHLDLLADNKYKPQRHNNHRRSRNVDSDLHEPSKLMHRSMKLQLRHMSHKHSQRRGNKSHHGLLSLALRNSGVADRHGPAKKHPPSPPGEIPASTTHPALIITSEEDDDQGITFTAKEGTDEPDCNANDVVEEPEEAACERRLPWTIDSDPQVSARAGVDPQHYPDEVPTSPWRHSSAQDPLLLSRSHGSSNECLALGLPRQRDDDDDDAFSTSSRSSSRHAVGARNREASPSRQEENKEDAEEEDRHQETRF